MTLRHLPLALLFSAAIPSVAYAHPRFWVMDDLTPSGSAGADLVLGQLEKPVNPYDPDDDIEMILLEPEVSFMAAPSLKLNLELPLGLAFYQAPGNNDESTGFVGNLEFGLQLLSSRVGRNSETSFGGGISFQGLTASDSDEEGLGALWGMLFTTLRDFGKYAPNTNTIRLHGDGRIDLDRVILQAELGLHLHFFDDTAPGEDDDAGTLRIGLGFGVLITPTVAFMAELTNTVFILDNNDDDEMYHVIDVGVRSDGGSSSFSVRLIAPIDDEGSPDAFGLGFDFLARF